MREYRVSVYKLNVQILSQAPLTKKSLLQLNEFTTMLDEFELGREDEMEPTSSVTFSTYYVKHASQNRERRAFLFIKHVRVFFFK